MDGALRILPDTSSLLAGLKVGESLCSEQISAGSVVWRPGTVDGGSSRDSGCDSERELHDEDLELKIDEGSVKSG